MMGVNKTALNRDCPLGQVLVFLLCFTLHLQGFFRRRIAPRTIEHVSCIRCGFPYTDGGDGVRGDQSSLTSNTILLPNRFPRAAFF